MCLASMSAGALQGFHSLEQVQPKATVTIDLPVEDIRELLNAVRVIRRLGPRLACILEQLSGKGDEA